MGCDQSLISCCGAIGDAILGITFCHSLISRLHGEPKVVAVAPSGSLIAMSS